MPLRSASGLASKSATACEMKPGTNVTITTPPFFATSCRTLSGTLRGTLQIARADECEKITGASVDAQRVFHRVRRDVAEIDEHAEPVHLADDFFAELRQAANAPACRRRHRPSAGCRCASASCSARRARGTCAASAASCRSNGRPPCRSASAILPALNDALDVSGGAGELEGLRPPLRHAMDDVDLFEGDADRFLAHHRRRRVDRPELSADAALAQARNVGHQFRHRLRDVGLAEVAAGIEIRAAPTGNRCGRRLPVSVYEWPWRVTGNHPDPRPLRPTPPPQPTPGR